MDKLRWAVKAGDQIGESPDDQKCGDHFIGKELECHDGDAHRPTPGDNPYFKGDRKGSDDKSKSPEKKHGQGQKHEYKSKDRTPQNKERGQQGGPEEQASFAVDRFNHYADMMEDADPNMQWDPIKKNELLEMVMRDTAREYNLDAEQLGFMNRGADHYGPIDNFLSSRERGSSGRSMWRPRQMDQPGTSPYDGPGGGPVNIPSPHLNQPGLMHEVDKMTRDDSPPEQQEDVTSPEMQDEHDKWGGDDYSGEEAPDADKGYDYQERQVDEWDPGQSPDEGKPYRKKERRRQTQKNYKRKKDKKKKEAKKKEAKSHLAISLNWNDQAQARPCEDGEDPKVGKCNPNTSPEGGGAPQGQEPDFSNLPPKPDEVDPYEGLPGAAPPDFSNLPKGKEQWNQHVTKRDAPTNFDSDKGRHTGRQPQPGMGLEPSADPSRDQRNAQHVQNMKRDDGSNPAKTAWGIGKMFGNHQPKKGQDGVTRGGLPAASEQEAKQLYDDSRAALQAGGWQNRSDMPGESVWQKGNTSVTVAYNGKGGKFGNKYAVFPTRQAASPARQKKKWFR